VDGIVYLVDAADPDRFRESAQELEVILETPSIEAVPICVLGNKIDKKTAVSEEALREGLGLARAVGRGRPLEVFMCSIAKRSGYAEGFQWLGRFLK
jgi:GTP-binding protein SAR1